MQDKLQKIKVFVVPGLFGLIFLTVAVYILIALFYKRAVSSPAKLPEVILPVIGVNGELVLSDTSTASSRLKKGRMSPPRLMVMSANLVAVYDKNQMTGIRILGEMSNVGGGFVDSADPVVRFYNTKGALVSQKIAQFSSGFDFKEAAPGDKTFYDVTVASPPASDRLEIVFNAVSSTDSANFLPLKIASRSMELKVASISANSQTASSAPPDIIASGSSASTPASVQQVEYYLVSGKVVNTYSNLVSDIVIYAWGKDPADKVFAFGRADFKNDLLSPSDKVDFKIIMLPIQANRKIESYEIAAWGKEYKLLTSSGN